MEFDPISGTTLDTQQSSRTEPYTPPVEVTFSERTFEHYKSLSNDWRKQIEDDRDFIRMSQWTEEKRLRTIRVLGRNTPLLEVDVISPAVEQAVGMLTAHTPSYSATGAEDSDVKVAAMISDVFRWIWNRNQMKPKSKLLLKDYYVASKGWVLSWWDEDMENGLGNVHYTLVDPLNVFVDPQTSELFHGDSPHIIIANIINKEQLLETIPNGEEVVKYALPTMETLRVSSGRGSSVSSGSGSITTDFRATNYLTLDRYSRVRVDVIHYHDQVSGFECEYYPQEAAQYEESPCFLQTDSKGNKTWYFEKSSLRDAERDFQNTGGLYHFARNLQTGQPEQIPGPEMEKEGYEVLAGSTIRLEKLPVKAAVQEQALARAGRKAIRIKRVYSVGSYLLEERILPITQYPIIPLINNFDRTPYVVSDVRRVKGLQEYINDLTSLVVAHAASTTNMKVGFPRGAYNEEELNKLWAKPGTTFIPYDAELGQLSQLSPSPLPNELYRNIEEAKRSVEHILGVYAMGQGDSRDAPNTYKGTLMLDEFAQRRIGTKREDFEAFLIQLGIVTYELLKAYLKEYRVIRLTRPNGKSARIAMNASQAPGNSLDTEAVRIDDLATSNYDITIVSGSTLPSNRWAQAEYYMNMYEKGIIDRQEVLLKSDVVDREGVQARMDQMKQMGGMIEQLQAQVKQLQGDLQTAQRESVSDRKRVEVIQFEKELAKITENMKAAQSAFESELRREVQSVKEKRKAKA